MMQNIYWVLTWNEYNHLPFSPFWPFWTLGSNNSWWPWDPYITSLSLKTWKSDLKNHQGRKILFWNSLVQKSSHFIEANDYQSPNDKIWVRINYYRVLRTIFLSDLQFCTTWIDKLSPLVFVTGIHGSDQMIPEKQYYIKQYEQNIIWL